MVAVKVDREERPDVDAVYMTATQAMTGQGGWPMTVFMTPDKEPFFCGTYYPRDHFRQLVLNVAQAWRDQRDDVTGQAKQVATALAENARGHRGRPARPAAASSTPLFRQAADVAVQGAGARLRRGRAAASAPRRSSRRRWCWSSCSATTSGPGRPAALRMAEGTCEAMARGGMYDQLGGGFARYSVDAAWVVPHFEKMLYDNALLARVYPHLWRRTGSALARRVAEETCDWMLRELRTAEGGFAASLDADSEGEEGKFYVWRPAELRAVLGPEDGEFAAAVFGVTEAGTFEHGASVLQLPLGARQTPSPARPGPCRPCWPPAPAGSARAGTTRWSPPGTGWPSRPWPKAACCSPARTSPRPRGRGRPAGRGAPDRRPARPHLAGRGRRDHRRGARGLRLRRRGIPHPVRGDRRGALAAAGRASCSIPRWAPSATARAASTTRRPTARR